MSLVKTYRSSESIKPTSQRAVFWFMKAKWSNLVWIGLPKSAYPLSLKSKFYTCSIFFRKRNSSWIICTDWWISTTIFCPESTMGRKRWDFVGTINRFPLKYHSNRKGFKKIISSFNTYTTSLR